MVGLVWMTSNKICLLQLPTSLNTPHPIRTDGPTSVMNSKSTSVGIAVEVPVNSPISDIIWSVWPSDISTRNKCAKYSKSVGTTTLVFRRHPPHLHSVRQQPLQMYDNIAIAKRFSGCKTRDATVLWKACVCWDTRWYCTERRFLHVPCAIPPSDCNGRVSPMRTIYRFADCVLIQKNGNASSISETTCMLRATAVLPIRPYTNQKKPYATWFWTTPLQALITGDTSTCVRNTTASTLAIVKATAS